MKVIYIRAASSCGYIRIGLAEGEERSVLVISEADYASVGSPLVGDTVDGESLRVLTLSDMRYRARLSALRILSYADNNERSLYRKLTAKGIGREVAAETAREMVSLGYVDEARQLDRIVTEEVSRKLTGPRKLFPKLMSKGYKSSDIEAAVDRLSAAGQIDFENSRQRLIEKELPPDATEADLKKLLYKNGYDIC